MNLPPDLHVVHPMRTVRLISFSLLLVSPWKAWAHEGYFVQWKNASAEYLAERPQLDSFCHWYWGHRTILYGDGATHHQLVLTLPEADKGFGWIRIDGRPKQTVRCEVRSRSRHLSVDFRNPQISGEIWLDLDWWDQGR